MSKGLESRKSEVFRVCALLLHSVTAECTPPTLSPKHGPRKMQIEAACGRARAAERFKPSALQFLEYLLKNCLASKVPLQNVQNEDYCFAWTVLPPTHGTVNLLLTPCFKVSNTSRANIWSISALLSQAPRDLPAVVEE